MRPAAAAFTAFLSRRGSSCTSSSGILSSSVTTCARFAFGGTSRRNMTVYSFSHRNSLARGALSVSNANSNANSCGSVDVSGSRISSSRGASAAGPASKIPRTPRKKRAFSSTSLSASASSSSSRTCSTRGTRAVELLPVYLTDARAVDRYCPDTCPDGALQLSVAENQMLEDLLVPAVREFASASSTEEDDKQTFYADMIYYQPTPGRPSLRRAMADYLQRILSLPGSLDAEGMVVGAGCNAVLENLCICLAEPGEGVLIPTPYYAAFEFDLVARAGLDIVPVPTMAHHPEVAIDTKDAIPPEAYYPNRSALDAAVEASRARGVEPKILLLSHPNNPLGVCYPPSVVRECIEWGRENEIHIVSDEIYAGSVYRESATITDGPTFESALSIATGQQSDSKGDGLGIGPYVHFVYALSKDFCLSGLRVGAAYSENPDIRLPMQKLNDLCQISSQTQLLVEKMLSAPSTSQGGEGYWSTDDFLPEARRRMKARCEKLEICLNEAGIPHLTSDSGMFVWMDMREFLPSREDGDESSAESQTSIDKRERALYLELLQKHGLLFTPGRSMKNELPGFFRCVFTAASDHEFDLGLERIIEFVNEKRGV